MAYRWADTYLPAPKRAALRGIVRDRLLALRARVRSRMAHVA